MEPTISRCLGGVVRMSWKCPSSAGRECVVEVARGRRGDLDQEPDTLRRCPPPLREPADPPRSACAADLDEGRRPELELEPLRALLRFMQKRVSLVSGGQQSERRLWELVVEFTP